MRLSENNGDAWRDIVDRAADGEICRSQFLASGWSWGHTYHKCVVQVAIPGYGYQTVTACAEPELKPDFHFIGEKRRQHEEEFVLENSRVRAVIDPVSGAVISLADKESGTERIDASRGGARLCIIDEANAKSIGGL